MNTRQRFVWGTSGALVFIAAFGQHSARAACGQICSETSGGRATINSNDSSSGNVGLAITVNSSQIWSIADVENGFSHFFKIFNDAQSKDGLTLDSGTTQVFHVNADNVPAADNTFQLGSSTFRWTKVYAVNGTIQTSDARMKKDVRPLRYGLDQILKLRPVTFKWKNGEDSSTHIGLLAQEVEKVVPEVVVRGSDESASLGMNYSELVPILIQAVQAQQRTIDADEARIGKLEYRIAKKGALTTSEIVGSGAALAVIPFFTGIVLKARRRRGRASRTQ